MRGIKKGGALALTFALLIGIISTGILTTPVNANPTTYQIGCAVNASGGSYTGTTQIYMYAGDEVTFNFTYPRPTGI